MTALYESVQLRSPRVSRLESGEGRVTQPADRRCGHPDCETRLSRYNPSGSCAQHDGWQDPRERQHA